MFCDLLSDSGVALDTSNERTLACAAAAVGVAVAAGRAATAEQIAESLRRQHPDGILPWRPGVAAAALNATELAAIWDQGNGDRARLALDLNAIPEPLETLENLLRFAVPWGSAVLVDYTGSPSGHWAWPIRLGVLPDPRGVALADRLTQQSMVRRGLARVVVLGVEGDDCDLLLLPMDLAEAAEIPGLPSTPPDEAIGAAVVLGGGGDSGPSIQALRDLRGRLSAEAAVLIRLAPAKMDRWTDQLVRSLSHDDPFDLALRNARSFSDTPDDPAATPGEHPGLPLIVTGPGLLRYARVTQQIPPLVQRLRAMPRQTTINLPRDIWKSLGIPEQPPEAAVPLPASEVANRLEELSLNQVDWVTEGGGATTTAVVAARATEAEATEKQRFSDVSLYKLDFKGEVLPSPVPDDEPLEAGVSYALGFAFRHNRRGIGANDSRKPIATVDAEDPMLLVTVKPRHSNSDGKFLVEEPTQYLRLPAKGDSEEARFKLTTPAGVKARLTLEISVFDRLNLIEWLVVSLPVGAPGLGSARVEQREEYRELGKRYPPRSAHIHVSRSEDTYHVAVTIERQDGKNVKAEAFTQFVDEKTLEAVLTSVRDFWIRCALDDFGKDLDATPQLRQKMLRELAEIGHKLWRLLFHTGPREGGALEAVGRLLRENAPPEGALVQVTLERGAHNFIFPWALLYPPDPDQPDAYAFWGVRYAIEQQVRSSALTRGDKDDGRLTPFDLRFALYGNFKQSADQRQLIERLAASASGALKVGSPIEHPRELLEDLKDCAADLIYIFSHGYTPFAFPTWLDAFRRGLTRRKGDPAAKMLLEVLQRDGFAEDDAWIELTKGTLKYTTLLTSDLRLRHRPIVFLNMCQSAQVMPGLLQSFVWLFLSRAQVRAVVGTECPVNPAFADLMGRELLPRLLAGKPVGTALREVRQALIEKRGNPLGLAYTLWGSATAQVAPPVFQSAALASAAANAKEVADG